jgi:predicted nucleic acid-binding protein
MRFVDANIFLRAITEADPIKAEACKALLRCVDGGEEEITTCEAVISEGVSVLLSPRIYGLDRREIRARLSPLLRMRGLRLARKHLYLEALDIYAQHPALDFEDVLCVV